MAKRLTNDLRHIDIRRLVRDRLLIPGTRFDWAWRRDEQVVASIRIEAGADSVTFYYLAGAEKRSVRQHVYLATTPCHYGRSRQWFTCPNCGKRVALLYLGKSVACRHCYRMAYRVQRENANDREIRRVDAIRERLGWEAGFLNGNGCKPKGMHWRTFYRLEAKHDQLVSSIVGCMKQHLGLLQTRLNRA